MANLIKILPAADETNLDLLSDLFVDFYFQMKEEGRIKVVKTARGNKLYIKHKQPVGVKERWEVLKRLRR